METMTLMMEQLIPEDNTHDDTDYHMNIIRLTEQPIETTATESSPRTKSGRL